MTRRSSCIAVGTLCYLLVLTTAASAQVGIVEGVNDWIAVWSSPSVIKEGIYLQDAGQYDLAAERMVCLIDYGTRVTATFIGGMRLDDGTHLGGVARIVVMDGDAKGCTGYIDSFSVRLARSAPRPRKLPSPCWLRKDEMAPVKTAVDAGNKKEASDLTQKVQERITECKKSPCAMTKEEGDAIRAAYAAGNSKLGRELSDKADERMNKCWGR